MANEAQVADIVVVGAGSAAFQAAVAARQQGAERVVMLEKAPEAGFGGNARFSPTIFRFVHEGERELREFLFDLDESAFEGIEIPRYTRDSYVRDFNAITLGRVDPALAEAIVDDSNAAMRWMLGLGFRWELTTHFELVDGVRRYDPGMLLSPRGGGIGQVTRWRELAIEMGVDIRYASGVSALHGNDQAVHGVSVSSPEGAYDITSGAVILCSGGYQASAEQRARFLGRNGDLMKVRGSAYDTGEVLSMAVGLGAATTGHWQGAHTNIWDAGAPDAGAPTNLNRAKPELGITVNRFGRRFLDEGSQDPQFLDRGYDRLVVDQPGGVAYQIVDAALRPLLPEDYENGSREEAPSIEALAEKLNLDPTRLRATVEEFNATVTGDRPFNPEVPDGRAAHSTPPKSNWATKIETAPFTGYPVTAAITFTFGGLRVNSDAQVLNVAGQPIRGLFASGDIVGLYYNHHLSASGQTRNVVFSRRAAAKAVKDLWS